MRGLKVLLLSHYDFAGSAHRVAEAVNLHTNNSVLPLNFLNIDYPKGLPRTPAILTQYEGQNIISAGSFDRFQALINDADIIHFKGDDIPTREPLKGIFIPEDKPIIATVNGSFFRRGGANVISGGQTPIKDYVKIADYRSSGDPTLLYDEYDGHWTPMPIDLTKFPDHPHEWPKTFVIAHSPSDENKKGTQKIRDAVKSLKLSGCDIELDIIKDVPYPEAVKRKQNASMFFDQTEMGYYGNAGLESMAFGIPTMTYLYDSVFGYAPDCACMNSGTTVKDITKNIADAYEKYQDKQAWGALSEQTYRYVKETHGYEKVGTMWEIIYNSLIG